MKSVIELKIFNKDKYKNFFIILVLFCLFTPHGTGYYFNGLPFNNTSEIIFFTILLPYFFFYRKIFNDLKIKILVLLIFFIKLILIFSPTNGVSLNQYFIEENNNNKFIRTFDSFWNKNNSYIQKFNFKKKEDFPIDWTFNSKLNAIGDIDIEKLNSDINKNKPINTFDYREHRFYNGKNFNNLPLNYISSFILILHNDGRVKLTSDGYIKTQVLVEDYVSKKNILSTSSSEFNLPKGVYSINVKNKYRGEKWSNKIYKSYNSNKFKSAFKSRDIYVEEKFKINNLKLFKFSSYMYEALIFSLILISILNLIIFKQREFKLLMFFLLIFFLQFYFLKNLIPNTGHLLQISLSLNLIFLIFYINIIKKLPKIFDIYFILIVPLTLGIFLFPNLQNLNSFGWWSLGDDWEWYQLFAREIVVENIWVNPDEKYTIRRYGIRLLIAFYKIIFGKTFFPQLIFEIWAILLIGFLTYKIGRLNDLSKKFSIISGLLVLIFFFGDNFRWLIGRGLTAYYSTFFIILLSYLICKFKILNFQRIFLISFLGGAIIWLREDHAILVSAVIFLKYKNNLDIGLKNLIFIKKCFIKNINQILTYVLILLFFTSLIFVKNYYSFGSLDSIHSVQSPITGKIESYKNIFRSLDDHVTYYGSMNFWWHSFYRILFASDPGSYPRISSIFLVGSFLSTVLFLFIKNKNFFILRPGILLIPISIFITYSLINNGAYSPRYCISFLPYAIIICLLFLEKTTKLISNKRSFS